MSYILKIHVNFKFKWIKNLYHSNYSFNNFLLASLKQNWLVFQ